jgi:hypothetical protein
LHPAHQQCASSNFRLILSGGGAPEPPFFFNLEKVGNVAVRMPSWCF